MITRSKIGLRITFIVVITALVIVLSPQSASAAVRLTFPGESPGIPAYARISEEAIHTDEWAAIPFYRDPSCVPPDFNLMRSFDVPRAFRCPLTVEGFEVWENGPGVDAAPMLSVSRAAEGMPVWFVKWPELEAAMRDGVLTIGELAGMESLIVGTADSYQEVLRPGESITIHATGSLSDGRRFHMFTHCACGQGLPPVVHISII